MKKEFLIQIDTQENKLTEELFKTYSVKDMKELLALLNNDLMKEELCRFMFKEMDGNHIKCRYCGSKDVHKHGFTKQGKQRYQCTCKKTFVLERNTLMY